jgi:hypothetical protein
MNTKFILRNETIYLRVTDARLEDRWHAITTKQRIDPALWNPKTERTRQPKSLPPDKLKRLIAIDEIVKRYREAVGKFETINLSSTYIDKEEFAKFVRDQVDDQKEARQKAAAEIQAAAEKLQKQSDFFPIWQRVIETTKNPKTGEKITGGTNRSKVQTMNKVSEYCAYRKITPCLETIDMDFYYDFDKYMDGESPVNGKYIKDPKLTAIGKNTKGKHVKELKAILRECEEKDMKVNPAYKRKAFKVIKAPVDDIYLNQEQLADLLEGNFEKKLTPAQSDLRDIFVCACYLGQRHGDWHQIKQENIKVIDGVEMLRIKQQKSGGYTIVHIPVHPVVKQILKKHKGELPEIIQNQPFNRQLKVIAERAGIDGTLKTHTARRSFATNAYLAGMDVHQIMQLTGHRSESSFLRYLKLEGKDFAKKASQHEFFQPKAQMKVA